MNNFAQKHRIICAHHSSKKFLINVCRLLPKQRKSLYVNGANIFVKNKNGSYTLTIKTFIVTHLAININKISIIYPIKRDRIGKLFKDVIS